MFKSKHRIFADRGGASMALVLVLMLILLLLGAVLTTGVLASAASATAAQIETRREYYAKNLAEYYTNSITKPFTAQQLSGEEVSIWLLLAQRIAQSGAQLEIRESHMALTPEQLPETAAWLGQASAEVQMELIEQNVVPIQDSAGMLEVTAQLRLEVRIDYREKRYSIFAYYHFTGYAAEKGSSRQVTGGMWELLGYDNA